MPQKIFCSALATQKNGREAVDYIASQTKAELKGSRCDLAVLFVSEHYDDAEAASLLSRFRELVVPEYLIACNASGVIGDKSEIEMEPAVSVLAMHLPDVRVRPFSLAPDDISRFHAGGDLIEALDLYPADQPNFICLADPATCDVRQLLRLFNEGYPGARVIGGLASGAAVGMESWLALNDQITASGAVGLALSGAIEFQTLVSQGCRPIGEPFIITKAGQNILYELAGRPAMQVLTEVLNKLSPPDQQLATHSLFAGIVMDEQRAHFERGDFLIRNIIGADQESGALAIGELLEIGQTLQFQLRDSRASSEDLKILLGKSRDAAKTGAEGALLVSCCGRGKGMFGEPDHDVRMIQTIRGPVPLAGFFANGEFGWVDKKNYVHGYTSSLTIFR